MIYFDYPTALPGGLELCSAEWNGRPAWTNGHVIFLGSPPLPLGDAVDKDKFDHAVKIAISDAMVLVHPVACARVGHCFYVWFDDGVTILDYRYWRMALERFPDAVFLADPHPTSKMAVLVKTCQGDVGLINRIREDGFVWPAEVKVLLPQSANAKSPEPSKSAEKSANTK